MAPPMTIKYRRSRARRLGILVGVATGTFSGDWSVSTLIVRLAASTSPWSTIAFGQVFLFHRVQLELGYRRRRRRWRGWKRQPLDFGSFQDRPSAQRQVRFLLLRAGTVSRSRSR